MGSHIVLGRLLGHEVDRRLTPKSPGSCNESFTELETILQTSYFGILLAGCRKVITRREV